MEITEEKLAKCAEALMKLNNSIEEMMTTLTDMGIELHAQLLRIEVIQDVMVKIAQQAKAGPSLPPPGRP